MAFRLASQDYGFTSQTIMNFTCLHRSQAKFNVQTFERSLVGRAGFEPAKRFASDLQSDLVDHLSTYPINSKAGERLPRLPAGREPLTAKIQL